MSEQPRGFNPEADREAFVEDVYEHSPYARMRAAQAERGQDFTAAFTDVDNTFYRKDRQTASDALAEQAEREQIPLVAVTGNDLAGIEKRQATNELPKFPVLIGSVGTEIHVLQPDGTYQRDEEFREMLLKVKHFDRPTIARAAAELVQDESMQAQELHFQRPEAENAYLANPEAPEARADVQEFKLSFYFYSETPEGVETVTQKAADAFGGQEIVVCEEIGYNREHADEAKKKYCLDVLPITKAGAVEYVVKRTEVKKGLVAGDSGNDTDMLMKSGKLQAVIVGGAKSELTSAVDAVAAAKPGKSSFRRVVGEDGTLKAMYVERGDRKGPESISYAGEVLQRAENIKKLREAREQNA